MSKRKGLSFDEKRARLKSLFSETKGVFLLKELEKIGQKEKGIVSKTVEEVLKSLVDDGLVCSDKIGTSNYFWSFPSAELVLHQVKVAELEGEVVKCRHSLDELTSKKQQLAKGREESEERSRKLARLEELKSSAGTLEDELRGFTENDPALLAAFDQDVRTAIDATNRWTDNIFSLRKWCEVKFQISGSNFDRNFELPEDFDYME